MSLLTISYGVGTDGLLIAKKVAEGLDVDLFDDARLKEEAVRLGIRPDEVRSFDEKLPGFFGRLMSYRPELYVNLLEEVIYEVAKGGKGVIVGHGSNVLLRDFDCAFHVLIYDSVRSRADRLMEEQGLSEEAAERLLQKRDREKKAFLQYAFRVDWDDPGLYDLVVNRQKVGADTAARLILDAARSPELMECGLKAIETMDRLKLMKKIEATLLENGISMDFLHTEVYGEGKVQIEGLARTEEERAKVKEILEGIEDIKELNLRLTLVPIGAE